MRVLIVAVAFLPAGVAAQTTMPADARPAVVKVTKGKGGALLSDAKGRTLYALSMRIANSRSGASLTYCIGPCQQVWTPLAAAADAAPIGEWKVLVGAQGPQWAYRGNLVFTYNADRTPGATGGDGYEDLWSAIRYVPPPPTLAAPAMVAARFVHGRYELGDSAGGALFVPAGNCAAQCAGWTPLAAGMAARDIGAWTVSRTGPNPQWAYRGKPVFVGQENDAGVPEGAVAIHP